MRDEGILGWAEPALTADEITDAVGFTKESIDRWIDAGWFSPSTVGRRGSRLFAVEDAAVLYAVNFLIEELRISASAALTHAHQIRRWKRGQFFVVAPESVASTFGRSRFSSFHRASKSYAGLMNRKTIAAGFSSTTRQHVGRLEGVVIAAMDESENNIRAQLDPSVAAAFASVDDQLRTEEVTLALAK